MFNTGCLEGPHFAHNVTTHRRLAAEQHSLVQSNAGELSCSRRWVLRREQQLKYNTLLIFFKIILKKH